MDDPRTSPSAPGRRRSLAHPKGRVVEPSALDEVRATLGDAERRRDLLIEHLHRLQDRFGRLAARHLAALAHEMRLPLAEVYEVATFYAHFDVVEDGAPPPGPTVRVCDSLTCSLFGAEELLERARAELGPGVRVVRAPCLGRCDHAPAAVVGHAPVDRTTPETIAAALAERRTEPALPVYPDLAAYRAAGGYRLLEECRAGRRSREEIFDTLDRSGLRGLGGAGFPTGRKWRIVHGQPAPRLMAVNADEGEPGTFKDRHVLETDPHRFLEGVLVAAWAVDVDAVYIYLRDEYPHLHRVLEKETAALDRAGLAAGRAIHLRRGAGAYVCGEESAMIESLEGKRGYPRNRPPFVAERGLFGRPTLVNNVETLFWVRELIERGPEWFASHGRRDRKGLRRFSVSGRVREPGVKLAPAGITARELIEEHCGGMIEGHVFRAYLPGGASGGILPASLDAPLDFGSIEPHGGFIGSAAVIVLSDKDDLKAAAVNLMRFFRDESCGQCTPCRIGTEKAVGLLARAAWDKPLLDDLAQVMRDASICGLGQAAPNVWKTLLRHFPEEIG